MATMASARPMPKDALTITTILKELGVTEYEPRVVNQLLEFTYGYVTSVLDDARVYANHAKKKVIDLEDVRLAVQMQLDRSFTTPPPRDMLLEIARMKNNSPLPFVKPHCGIRLPPDRYCLNSCNYRLKSTVPKKFGHSSLSSAVQQAAAGVKLAGKPGQQLQLIKRPSAASLTTIPRTQSISAPKPVIKFSASPSGLQGQSMMTPRPKIQISTGGHVELSGVKVETDHDSFKRKRESEDFELVEH